MKKIKDISRKKPLLLVLAVCVLIAMFQYMPKSMLYVFQNDMLNNYVKELFDILWPVAMSLLFGFGFIYHRKGFGATLVAGMFLFVLHTCLALFLLRKSKQPAIFARLEQLRNRNGWAAE